MEGTRTVSRSTTGAGARKRTSRTRIAGRDAFEAALREIERMPRRAPEEDLAREYLPRFIAQLRALGYTQDDIVSTIARMNLGLTERQIRAADSAWAKEHRDGKGAARGAAGAASGGGGAAGGGAHGDGAGSAGAPRGAAAQGGTAGGGGPAGGGGAGRARLAHAGLAGAGALKR
jgi:hypothetical protein